MLRRAQSPLPPWAGTTRCTGKSASTPTFPPLARCNLEIYALAVAKASEEGAHLVVLPEGYGLVGRPAENDKQVFEPFLSQSRHKLVCANSTVGELAPQQFEVSCLAKRHNIAVAANIFVTLTNNRTNRIQEIVFGPSGKVISTYSKCICFPRKKWAEPGPFRPTSFRYLGKTFGILGLFRRCLPLRVERIFPTGCFEKPMESILLFGRSVR